MWPCSSKKKEKKLQTRDGRKFRLAVLFSLLLLTCFGLASMNPILVKVFAEMVSGIVGIFLIFCGGNVATKGVLGKWQKATVEGNSPKGALGAPPPAPSVDTNEYQRGVVG